MTSKRNIPTRRFIKPSFTFLIEKKRDVQPAAKPARAVAPERKKKVDDFTASIPRPKADVGGGDKAKRTSIVDVINGG